MFKKSDETKELDNVQTLIGPSIEVKGDFEGEGDVIVEGRLSGTLKTKKDLRVGPEAKIEANVEAENVFVAGKLKGNIKAHQAIEMVEGSEVCGDLETKSLMIEKGAIFNGNCIMGSDVRDEDKKEKREREKEFKKKQGNLEEVEEIYGNDEVNNS